MVEDRIAEYDAKVSDYLTDTQTRLGTLAQGLTDVVDNTFTDSSLTALLQAAAPAPIEYTFQGASFDFLTYEENKDTGLDGLLQVQVALKEDPSQQGAFGFYLTATDNADEFSLFVQKGDPVGPTLVREIAAAYETANPGSTVTVDYFKPKAKGGCGGKCSH